ncbi:MAG: flagellar hook-associated protein FlgL [Pseudomonadota bacterium]
MRVSTLSFSQNFNLQLGRQQSGLLNTQQQVASGERFMRPSQDPVAATRALELQQSIDATGQYAVNADRARGRLALAESAVRTVGDNLQRVRELAVEAANGAASAESRALIANEVRQRLEGLLTLANQQEPNGQYLFAGFSTQTRPFAPTPGGIQYNGDQGQRLLQIGPNRYVADGDPGSRVFQMARNGDGVMTVGVGSSNVGTAVVGGRGLADPAQWDGGTYQVVFTAPDAYEVRDAGNAVIATGAYVSGGSILFRGVKLEVSGTPVAGDSFSVGPSALQDIFTTVQQFADALLIGGNAGTERARFQNAINRSLNDLDQAIGSVLEVRAEIGGRLQAIDEQQRVNTDVDVELKTLLSSVKDLDYAEALTRLNQQLVGLQASQQSYARLQGLSLFNFL